MGADGGVKICTVEEVKQKWKEIKSELLINLRGDPLLKEAKFLPSNVDKLSGDEIVKLFSFMRSCDCPFHYHGVIILGNGDYVSSDMNLLSSIFPGVYVETWT